MVQGLCNGLGIRRGDKYIEIKSIEIYVQVLYTRTLLFTIFYSKREADSRFLIKIATICSKNYKIIVIFYYELKLESVLRLLHFST